MMSVFEEQGAAVRALEGDRLTVGFVAALVSMATGVSVRDIAAGKRCAARARHMTMYLVHVGLSWPMGRVASAFGRDRSTACNAVHIIEDMRDEPGFDAALDELEAVVRRAPAPMIASGVGA